MKDRNFSQEELDDAKYFKKLAIITAVIVVLVMLIVGMTTTAKPFCWFSIAIASVYVGFFKGRANLFRRKYGFYPWSNKAP